MVRKLIGKVLETLTISSLRRSIEARIPIKGYILDNGSGYKGSWDYNNREDVASIDKLYGDDCTNLPFKNDEFDMVVFSGVIQYVEDYEKALKEIYRVLRRDGLFLITTINRNSLLRNFGLITKKPKIGESQLFSSEEIEELLQKHNFKIMEKWGASFIPITFELCSNICYICKK